MPFLSTGYLRLINPTPEKLTSYECGEEPTGNAWLPFNSRFYVIALVFLLFDVEMVFVFPWAIVFGNREMNSIDPRWGGVALTEMFIFLGILVLGLAYVWRKGDLDWIKPEPVVPTVDTNIPRSLYDQLNTEQSAYEVKEFSLQVTAVKDLVAETVQPSTTEASYVPQPKKIMFKPSFKKPGNE